MRARVITAAAAVALAAGGLTIGWLGHTPSAAPDTVLRVHAGVAADNLLPNPSFEQRVAPWSGAGVTRVDLGAAAPNGRFVARVAARNAGAHTTLALDDWPGAVGASTAGTAYSASAFVAAAAPPTEGRHAYLVVREHAGDRTIASWPSAPVPLSEAFQRLSVTGTAHRSGDQVDVYVYVADAATGDAMEVDAAQLTARFPRPITNMVGNASFEQAGGWAAADATLGRARTPNAPDGANVAVARYSGSGGFAVDDWPGTPVPRASTTLQAAALVAAEGAASVGRSARLIAREHAPDGTYVGEADSSSVTLTGNFTPLTTTVTTRRPGDLVDVYVALDDPHPGDALRLDAVSLAPTSSTLGELALDVDQSNVLGDTSRYAYVVVQESRYDLVAAIHAANPATKVLAYQQAGSTLWQPSCAPDAASHVPHDAYGVGYCWIRNHDPSWLLTDRAGRELTYGDYQRNVLTDVGSAGYRTAWADNVQAQVKADGFDGVYLDDVNVHPGHGRDGTLARYSDRAYGAATVGFVASVGDRLRQAGLIVAANVALEPWVAWQSAAAAQLAGHLDVVAKEFWSHFGIACSARYGDAFTDPASVDSLTHNRNPDLGTLLGYAGRLQQAGAGFAAIDYDAAGDRRRMSYGRAAFLLAWDGHPGSVYLNRDVGPRNPDGTCAALDPADPSWTADLGLPTGPVLRGGGVWTRSYTDGLVVLNPSRTSAATVRLDGTYATTDGTSLSGTVRIAPGSALLLRRTALS